MRFCQSKIFDKIKLKLKMVKWLILVNNIWINKQKFININKTINA
jgi:hypothetical protein